MRGAARQRTRGAILSTAPRPYRLVVPATASHVASARLFVAAVVAAAGVDEDVVDDLRLAVSDLVGEIVAEGTAGEVTLEVSPAAGTVTIRPWGAVVPEQDFGALEITTALFPASRVEGDAVVVDLADDDG